MEIRDINETDRYGRTQLHISAEKGSQAQVLRLLENGAELDMGDDTEKTALHYAVLNGHTNIVKILLEEGADSNLQDENGCSCLLLLRRNIEQILPLLLEFGANLEIADYEGRTLLNLAAQTKDKNFIKFLLDAGADVNCQDAKGMTPLLNAAKAKNYEVVEFLLKQNNSKGSNLIDLLHKAIDGKSLRDFYQNNNEKMAESDA
jgi:ankyrin repeat protein